MDEERLLFYLLYFSRTTTVTCESTRVSEGSDLRVCETGQQRDNVVHHVLIINDAVLTLFHQHHHKVAEVTLELLPLRPRHDERVVAIVLSRGTCTINIILIITIHKPRCERKSSTFNDIIKDLFRQLF